MHSGTEDTFASIRRAPLNLSASARLHAESVKFDAISATADQVIDSDKLVVGEYPTFASRGHGAYVWDVDGNRYLDFILAYGTIILGHAEASVDDAVIAEIRRGFALSMQVATRTQLTKQLTDIIPNAEMALLLKTGSDATSAAVRLCRSFTGRDVVLRWGYNGWHEWCAVRRAGIPTEVSHKVDTFDYNDPQSLDDKLSRYAGQVACIVMMPFGT